MKKWIAENVLRVEKKANQEDKKNNPRWHKLLNDYYDLADDLKFKVDKEFLQNISMETLTEIVEVLKEKKNDKI